MLMTEGYKAILWMGGVHCIFHIYNVGTKVIMGGSYWRLALSLMVSNGKLNFFIQSVY